MPEQKFKSEADRAIDEMQTRISEIPSIARIVWVTAIMCTLLGYVAGRFHP